jgi:hypothetical protein
MSAKGLYKKGPWSRVDVHGVLTKFAKMHTFGGAMFGATALAIAGYAIFYLRPSTRVMSSM